MDTASAKVITSPISVAPLIPSRRNVIDWTHKVLNRPPFPVSPVQAVLKNKTPKQPFYYDGKYPVVLSWEPYQKWVEDFAPDVQQQLINTWHKDDRIDGVSTIGGWNGKHYLGWIDFDLDDFNSAESMQLSVNAWIEKYPILNTAPRFSTPSGGLRFLVAWTTDPLKNGWGDNNGFAFEPDADNRLGELLTGNGGHTLLPPTKGTNGKCYGNWVNFGVYPPVVESPESIGLYIVKTAKGQTGTKLDKSATRSKPELKAKLDRKPDDFDESLSRKHFLDTVVYPRLVSNPSLLFGHQKGWKGAGKNAHCDLCTTPEKNPSFSVSPDDPVCKCFGCWPEGGSFLDYLMIKENFSQNDYAKAVDRLAEIAGVGSYRDWWEKNTPSSVRNPREEKKTAKPAENKFAIPIRYDKQGQPKLTPASAVANILVEKYRSTLAYNAEGQIFYRYEAESRGLWSAEDDVFIKGVIQSEINATPLCDLYGANYINSIFQLMQNLLAIRRWNESNGLLPLANGVLELKTGKLLEHSPGYRLTWQLPYDYDASATCDPIIEWLKESQDNDPQRVQLLRAYLKAVVCGRTDLQRLLECIGPGGTGKSTYTRLAIALVGLQNTFITELKHLEQNRFETSGIRGKRVILISDSERYGGNITTLKALTGQDPIRHEEKHKKQGSGFICSAMVIIAANEAIQSADYTSGLERRRITVPFLNQVAPSKRKDLLTIGNAGVSGEFVPYLPGLLNWVLALPDEEMVSLLLNTQLSVPSLQRWKAESLIESNPIAEWLESCIVYDNSPETKTYVGVATKIRISQGDVERSESWEEYEKTNDWLYANYCEFTGYAGSKPVSLKRFVTLLEDLCRSQLRLDVQRRRDGNGSHFVGLAIRSSSSIYNNYPKLISELFAVPNTRSESTADPQIQSQSEQPDSRTHEPESRDYAKSIGSDTIQVPVSPPAEKVRYVAQPRDELRVGDHVVYTGDMQNIRSQFNGGALPIAHIDEIGVSVNVRCRLKDGGLTLSIPIRWVQLFELPEEGGEQS